MATPKGDARVEEYRARAEASAVLAEAAVLDRAREQHVAAAKAWAALADAEEAQAATARAQKGRINIGRDTAAADL